MAKIKYSVDTKGVLQAHADTVVKGRVVRVGVRGATVDGEGKTDRGAWAQITFDLFTERDAIQNGTGERGVVI